MPFGSYSTPTTLYSRYSSPTAGMSAGEASKFYEETRAKKSAEASRKEAQNKLYATAFDQYRKEGRAATPTFNAPTSGFGGPTPPPKTGGIAGLPTSGNDWYNPAFQKWFKETWLPGQKPAPATEINPANFTRTATEYTESPEVAARRERTAAVADALKKMERSPLTNADIGENITGFGPRLSQYIAANTAPDTVSYDVLQNPEGGYTFAPMGASSLTPGGGLLDRALASYIRPGQNIRLSSPEGLNSFDSLLPGYNVTGAYGNPFDTLTGTTRTYQTPDEAAYLAARNAQEFAPSAALTPIQRLMQQAGLWEGYDPEKLKKQALAAQG